MGSIQRNFKITSGSEIDDLFAACRYVHRKGFVFPIWFVITYLTRATNEQGKKCTVPKMVTDVKIYGIEYDPRDDQVLNLNGFCKVDIQPLEDSDRIYKFHARYNYRSRSGTITLE